MCSVYAEARHGYTAIELSEKTIDHITKTFTNKNSHNARSQNKTNHIAPATG